MSQSKYKSIRILSHVYDTISMGNTPIFNVI
jgi:hypothetical protein